MKHRFERVINGTEEQKKLATDEAQRLYDVGWSDNEGVLSKEVTSTPFHNFVKERVYEFTADYLKHLGISKEIHPPRLIVIEKGGTLELEKGRISGGYHNAMKGYVVSDESESKAVFASRVAHEYFHSLGYGSLQVVGDEPNDEFHPYRSGITMHDREDPYKRYFDNAEEALATDFAQQFLEYVAGYDEGIANEIRSRDVVVNWFKSNVVFRRDYPEDKYDDFIVLLERLKALPAAEDVVAVLEDVSKEDSYKIGYAFAYLKELFKDPAEYVIEREDERRRLNEYINRIVIASDSSLTESQVRAAFFEAHLSGNYLTLARMVESVLGPGSFRVMAEELSSKKTAVDDSDVSES